MLADTIDATLPGNDIKVGSANGRVVLSGEAQDAVDAQKANDIASRFSGDEKIIDSLDISSSQQVQLNVRFVEINRQVGHELGVNFGVSYSGAGGSISFNSSPQAGSGSPAGEIIGSLLSGGFSVDASIKALEDRGVARAAGRAEPDRAVGPAGELPGRRRIPDSRLGRQQFGDDPVQALRRQPRVHAHRAEARADQSRHRSRRFPRSTRPRPTRSATSRFPVSSVRRAQTSVDLKSGQSFMIAGLLQNQNDISTERLPGLGKLPVLGKLFTSKSYQRRETDLVIIVTPYLVKPIDPTKKLRTPASDTKAPSNLDYLLGDTEEVRTASAAGARDAIRAGRRPLSRPAGELRMPPKERRRAQGV